MSLFPNLRVPEAPAGIDLRCCDVAAMLAEVRGARLIVADPPWQYTEGAAGKGMAQPELNGIYNCMGDAEIASVLDAAHDCAAESARLAVWTTHPKLMEWIGAGHAGPRWRYVSGGSWAKLQQVGVGYHWRGRTEPVHLFAKGATGRPGALLENGYESPPTDHSEKPVEWLRAWVRAWTDPGDLVVEVFAGMAPLARACAAEGRRYVGAEIDPVRHAEALVRLRLYLSLEVT